MENAAKEYRFFCLRKFKPENPNFHLKRVAHLKWGKALLAVGKNEDALKTFDLMFKIKDVEDDLEKPTLHFWRGKARHAVGKKGYCEDWKKARRAGIEEAKVLLKEYC